MKELIICLSSASTVRSLSYRSGSIARQRRWLMTERKVIKNNWEEPIVRPLEESESEAFSQFTFPPESKMGICLQELRRIFESRFAAPRASHEERYLWDPWHVTHRSEDYASRERSVEIKENVESSVEVDSLEEAAVAARQSTSKQSSTKKKKQQESQSTASCQYSLSQSTASCQYSMLRTPALEYFADIPEFDDFLFELSEFGRKQLGCDAYTPPWLALYTHGHEMNWHTDAPHGPFAFVISLTPDSYYAATDANKPGFFTGGETVLLQPKILDYWRSFDGNKGLEANSIIQVIPPNQFGKLIIFDGRFPHRVSPVSGTRDPRRGRLVLTGWFSEPRVRAEGGLASTDGELNKAAQEILDTALDQASDAATQCDLARVIGFIALRLEIQSDGSVLSVTSLADTLIPDPAEMTNFFSTAASFNDQEEKSIDDYTASEAADKNDDNEFESADADLEQLADFADAPPDRALRLLLRASLLGVRFPKAEIPTTVTVPCLFE